MLRSLRKMFRYRLRSTDGPRGRPFNWLIDDSPWAVRYLVLRRRLLGGTRSRFLMPGAVLRIDEANSVVQLRGNCPSSQKRRPWELKMQKTGLGSKNGCLWSPFRLWCDGAGDPTWERPNGATQGSAVEAEPDTDSHLHGWDDLTGCRVCFGRAVMGSISDLIFEDRSWTVLFFVLNTGRWWARRRLLLLPDWIDAFCRPEAMLRLKVARELVCDAPEFKPALLLDRNYEEELISIYYR